MTLSSDLLSQRELEARLLMKDYNGAIKIYQKIIDQDSRNLKLYLKLGKLYRIMGKHSMALITYVDCSFIDPSHQSPHKQIIDTLKYMYLRNIYFFPVLALNFSHIYLNGRSTNSFVFTNQNKSYITIKGNQALSSFIGKCIANPIKISKIESMLLADITSYNILNLTRFLKITGQRQLRIIHIRNINDLHFILIFARSISFRSLLLENMENVSEVAEINAIRIVIINSSLKGAEIKVKRYFINLSHIAIPFSFTNKPRVIITRLNKGILLNLSYSKIKILWLRFEELKEFDLKIFKLMVSLRKAHLENCKLVGGIEGNIKNIVHIEFVSVFNLYILISLIRASNSLKSIHICDIPEPISVNLIEIILINQLLREFIMTNCNVSGALISFIYESFFKFRRRKLVGIANCGFTDVLNRMECNFCNKLVLNTEFHCMELRKKTWPETYVEWYYR